MKNNFFQNGFSAIILAVIIVLVVAGGIFTWWYFSSIPASISTPTTIPSPTSSSDEDVANWKVYKNERYGYEIKYPPGIITFFEESGKIFLTHSISFEHHNPCDFKGDPADVLKKITDLDVGMEIVEGRDIIETTILKESDYFKQNFILVNKVKTEPGFVDEVEIGSLKGYRITSGVEGCGKYTYYFSLAPKRTLFIERSFVPELQPIIADYEKYLKAPGIISPEKEEELFNQIFSTFKFFEENEITDWKTFRNDEYGFLFKYPPNFTVIKDNFSSPGRKYLEMGDSSIPEKPTLELYVDFDGFGPFFPDVKYYIQRKMDKIEIANIEDYPVSKDNSDGEKIIITNFDADLGKRAYLFVFRFKEGGEDLTSIFKQLLSTFRFVE